MRHESEIRAVLRRIALDVRALEKRLKRTPDAAERQAIEKEIFARTFLASALAWTLVSDAPDEMISIDSTQPFLPIQRARRRRKPRKEQ